MKSVFKPPSNWKRLFECVKAIRKNTPAPVDTIGCSHLFDKTASNETRRYHILLALMLSAQTKDQVTAEAMNSLIQNGCTPEIISKMPTPKLNAFISKVGFHNMKTKHIKEATDLILRLHNGKTPRTYEELVALPGVGPKMAHLFLQESDGVVLGIGVDTHVHRIAQRFGWVPSSVKTPEDTRKALESWLPREYWRDINGLLVGMGQTLCTPRFPRCADCEAHQLCPYAYAEDKKRCRKRQNIIDIEEICECLEDQQLLTTTGMSFESPYNRNVYIASLPPSFTDDDLRSLFAPYGNIISSALVKDKFTGRCKGYGFVLFEHYRDAYNAVIALQGSVVARTRVQVRLARPEASAKKVYPLLCQEAMVCQVTHPPYVYVYPQTHIMSQ